MMIGEPNRRNPTVTVPPWSMINDPTVSFPSFPLGDNNGYGGGGDYFDPYTSLVLPESLQRYLPSNDVAGNLDSDSDESDIPVDNISCDHFRMFDFKVRRCARARSHDWTDCPYAHPGEKARRRDPRKYHYSGTACPDFRKGSCRKGDACEFAHGVFECWLHPARYRTQPCKDGTNCRRRVCFFAHTQEQLRVLPQSPSPRGASAVAEFYDGSPLRQAIEASCTKAIPFAVPSLSVSPPMTPPSDSPPLSPIMSRSLGSNPVNGMVASLRSLQLGKMKSMPASWVGSPVFGSPRPPILSPGSCSVPSTPARSGLRNMGLCEEEPEMERVDSGRSLRAKMVEKLSRENSVDWVGGSSSAGDGPDVAWVSDLVKW